MVDADLEEWLDLEADIEELERFLDENPIARWRAWDSPRTSQRRALQEFGPDITLFLGGNRSGKTEQARAVAVAFALGRDHPATIEWAEENGFDLALIPPGPGDVFLVAPGGADSFRVHRKPIRKLLPKCTCGLSARQCRCIHWTGYNGKDEARVEITVPGYEDKATIWFKSFKQGRDAFQGFEGRLIVFDEEPPWDVYDECRMRVGKEPVRVLFSMTPLKGATWVKHDLVDGGEDGRDVTVHWLDTLDNPHLSPEARRQLECTFAGMTEAQRAARRHGKFVALEGLAYPMFDRSIHVVEPFPIPPEWPRYRVLDWGTRVPTAVLWAARSPENQLVLYREHYQELRTVGWHARRIRELEGWKKVTPEVRKQWEAQKSKLPRIVKTDGDLWYADETTEQITQAWADDAAKQQILDLNIEHQLLFLKVKKSQGSVAEGIALVQGRLRRPELANETCRRCSGEKVLPSGKDCPVCHARGVVGTEFAPPGLVVFDTLKHWLKEIEAYQMPKDPGNRNPSEKPVEKDDHLMDCTRYLCLRVRFSLA